jgi:SAM-dependent methyltransferase
MTVESTGCRTVPDRAALYDWECREVLGRTEQDVEFWRAVVGREPSGRVLELACGTGRVTLPLAAAGFSIVGLDVDSTMLAVARDRRGAARWPLLVTSDMRRFALRCRFDAIIVPYNSIQLLTDQDDVSACLRGLAEHLAPTGVVGLEVTDFQRGSVETDVGHEPIHAGRLAGEPLTLSGSLTHDLTARVSRYRRSFAGPDWTIEDQVVIRSYRRDELAVLLSAAGLVPERWWQDRSVTRVVASRPAR